MNAPIAVVGLGNLLLGDEGLGVHAIRSIRRQWQHPQVVCIDGGTLGLTLLPYIEDARYILFLDAVRTDAPPGTVLEIPLLEARPRIPLKCSAHDIALPDLVALLRLRRGERLCDVRLIGVVPERIDVTDTLSPTVRAALPEVLDRTHRILHNWITQCTRTEGARCASACPDAS